MISLTLLFLGSFWEASMDIVAFPQNYKKSFWEKIANYFDQKGHTFFGQKFWDHRVAWRNKYKNQDPKQGPRFFGSNTFLVPFMDGWHLIKIMWILHLLSAIIFYRAITEYLLLDVLILYVVFCTGHELFFKLNNLNYFKNE